MVVGFALVGVLIVVFCVVVCVATSGGAWWLATLCAVLYLMSIVYALCKEGRK